MVKKTYYLTIDEAIEAARERRKSPPYGHYAVRQDERNKSRLTVGRAGRGLENSVVWSTKNDVREGQKHCRAKLDFEDIPNIAELYRSGFTYVQIAEKYDVTPEAISQAIRGKTWDRTDKRPSAGANWRIEKPMSSTHGHVIPGECYPTPTSAVQTLLRYVEFRKGDIFLEPCRGKERAIYDAVSLPQKQKAWTELSEGRDYLTTMIPAGSVDVIITNPPFSLTCEFLEKSLMELKPDGTLIYLQRVNFLGTKKRVPFWQKVGMPNKFPVLVPRPRFVGAGSDSTEYAWFIYDRGNRLPLVPDGLSVMTNLFI